MRQKQCLAWRDEVGRRGKGSGTTVSGMHDLSQPLRSLCFSIVEIDATQRVCGGRGGGRSVSRTA